MLLTIPTPPAPLIETAIPVEISVTPATVQAAITAAKCGQRIDLGPGDYPIIRVYNLKPSCPVVIDGSSGAVIHNMPFSNASNWIVERATFGPYVYGQISISASDHIAIRNSVSSGAGTNFVGVVDSSYIEASDNTVQGSGSDGFDIAGDSHFNSIHDNRCVGNSPIGASHPDCVQAWSILGKPQLTDLWITNNVAIGSTQGFDGFNPANGGFSRVYISGNSIATIQVNAGSWYACKSCIMTGNYAYTLLGQPKGDGGARWLMTDSATGTPDSGASGNYAADNLNGAAP